MAPGSADQQAAILRAQTDEHEAWMAYASAARRQAPMDVRRSLFKRALELLDRSAEVERVADGEKVVTG